MPQDIRKQFAEIVQKLKANRITRQEWSDWFVTHYQDPELEQIRVKIVRLSISNSLHTEEGKERLSQSQKILKGN
jgi:hypothetical protein